MLQLEKKQPYSVFIEAGRRAFHMGTGLTWDGLHWRVTGSYQDNPYREQPYRRLWDQGYRDAKRKWYDRRDPEERRTANLKRRAPAPKGIQRPVKPGAFKIDRPPQRRRPT